MPLCATSFEDRQAASTPTKLYTTSKSGTVIQWIPSHCGVWGNEQADRLAKYDAEQQQEENSVSLQR
ncbi:Hypothetical predicted protein [Mytilus galloprovincialis]|uniref:RNase H type-1 domain-containing protein n=1 Tax=Mytilus galloprovincialis TaxID=29158 RepID=A0A8B6GQI3_MYTGA|nr:Hypothetical predicted protein [Mytilus galloprovincialis]